MTILYATLLKVYPSLKSLTQKERFEALRSLAGSKNRKIAKAASSYMGLTFMRKRLVCLAEARIACACDLLKRLDTKEKIIIFGERISQADELYRLLQQIILREWGVTIPKWEIRQTVMHWSVFGQEVYGF